MPYPRAYIFLIAVLLLTFPAFYPNYFSQIGTAAWQYHFHGVTAGAWMLLLIWQSWSIHHGKRAAHRAAGKTMFVITPLFVAGGLLVMSVMVVGEDPFRAMFGVRLAAVDALAIITFVCFIYAALKHRRNVQLHARYMLATVFILFAPIASRLIPGFVPGLTIRSLEELPRWGLGLHLSHVLTIVLALMLFARDRENGRPWLITIAVIIAQSIVFEVAGKIALWTAFNEWLGSTAPAALMVAGIVIGIAAVFLGWRASR